ncbi:hypothetical protein ACQ4PT_025509 [Festuca glaucescens]
MELSRRTVWISSGLLARLLMIAVLLMSVRFILDNRVVFRNDDYGEYGYYRSDPGVYKLQSHKYVVASAIVGAAGNLLQIPVAMYLLCKSRKTTPSAMIHDISMHADKAISVVLASGVGAGFGATDDMMRLIRDGPWGYLPQVQQDLLSYYKKAIIAVVFLFIGMLLSLCATVVSARLRARAINDSEDV